MQTQLQNLSDTYTPGKNGWDKRTPKSEVAVATTDPRNELDRQGNNLENS
jgi:hypothetical protein